MKIISFSYKNKGDKEKSGIFSNLQEKYILNFKPYSILEEKIFDEDLLSFNFNYTSSFADKNFYKNKKHIKKITKKYNEDIFLQNDFIKDFNDIIICNGKIFTSIFIDEIVKYACRKNNLDISKVNVTLIDGGDFCTNIILDILKEEVNHFNVITQRKNELDTYADDVLSYNGLNINIYTKENKDFSFNQSEIVINCGKDDYKNDYALRQNMVYVDISDDKIKHYNLIRKREDISIYNGFSFIISDKTYNSDIIEACYYVKYNYFRNYIIEKRINETKKIKKMLKSNNCELKKCFYK